MEAVLDRDETGNLVRKAGVMGVVVAGGEVRPGDAITRRAAAGAPPPARTGLKGYARGPAAARIPPVGAGFKPARRTDVDRDSIPYHS